MHFYSFTGATEYVIASYGPVATSATGAQNLLRETLAGSLTIASVPMYQGLGNQWVSFSGILPFRYLHSGEEG